MLFIPRHSGNKRSVWRGGGKRSREKKPESRAADVRTLLARYIQGIAPISEKTMLNKPHLRAVTGAADETHADAPVPQQPYVVNCMTASTTATDLPVQLHVLVNASFASGCPGRCRSFIPESQVPLKPPFCCGTVMTWFGR